MPLCKAVRLFVPERERERRAKHTVLMFFSMPFTYNFSYQYPNYRILTWMNKLSICTHSPPSHTGLWRGDGRIGRLVRRMFFWSFWFKGDSIPSSPSKSPTDYRTRYQTPRWHQLSWMRIAHLAHKPQKVCQHPVLLPSCVAHCSCHKCCFHLSSPNIQVHNNIT